MENETKPNVILLAKTMPVNGDNMEAVVAAAAKLCYSKVGASEIKEKLRDIYSSLNLSKTPKATDLEEYFDLYASFIYFKLKIRTYFPLFIFILLLNF